MSELLINESNGISVPVETFSTYERVDSETLMSDPDSKQDVFEDYKKNIINGVSSTCSVDCLPVEQNVASKTVEEQNDEYVQNVYERGASTTINNVSWGRLKVNFRIMEHRDEYKKENNSVIL